MDQEPEYVSEASRATLPGFQSEDHTEYPAWLAGESQAVENTDLNCMDDSLLCKEIFDSFAPLSHSGLNHLSHSGFVSNTTEVTGNNNASSGIADLANIDLDTPPDFQLTVSITSYPSSSSLLTFLTYKRDP